MPDTPPFAYHRLIVGYHGCDRLTVERVLLRGESLERSDNRFDWLGTGILLLGARLRASSGVRPMEAVEG